MNDLIVSMLKEKTGVAMCDSGGDSGRNWQRNQATNFQKEAEVTIDTDFLSDGDEIYPDVSLYHHLINTLELDGLCNEFNTKFKDMIDWDGEVAYGISVEAENWLSDNNLKVLTTWNSYNGESMLSQVIQGANISLDDSSNFEFPEYHLLQIHQGADVRGGYTDAKLFKAIDDQYLGIATVYGSVDGKEVSTSYDGYSLYYDDTSEQVKYKKGMEIDLYISA